MRKFLFLFIIVSFIFTGFLSAQDTLPKITVKNVNNQIIISWKNNYGLKIANINIQRSRDSLKSFTTIGTVLNPLNKENGFVDHKSTATNFFYRVFVAFEGGTYFFSQSHHPVIDTTHQAIITPFADEPITTESTVTIIEEPGADRSLGEFLPHVKIPKVVVPVGFVPSKFIYANKENNLVINLPDADKEKFSLRFFDDKDKQVLEIKKITEPYLLMEKVNFMHAGWFYYSLYNDGILLEKYKFYIGKEGRVWPPPPETKKSADGKENN